ncbi:MAG TPA: hypothetical protein DDW49_11410 [Deltaproteobacteria bacterium]|nr:MAG: hypothetical protein A2048_05620 [Deltaproteobacteria bacterium GWA2_45_12]HBF13974.1 hypothetical protein [Deltaproteobacteria bacterium]
MSAIAEKEILTLIQNVSGRLRLQFPRDKRDIPDVDQFLELPGVQEVTYNMLTKSLLVLYNIQITTADELMNYMERYCPWLEIRTGKAWGEVPFGHDLLSQIIFGTLAKSNRYVRKQLGGKADLTSIVPTAMIGWSLWELVRRPTRPGWFDILRAVEIYVVSIANHQQH